MKDRCKCGAWSCLDHDSCPKCGREVAVHGCEKCGASVMTRDDVCCGCGTPNPRLGGKFREHLIKKIDDSLNNEILMKAPTPRTDAMAFHFINHDSSAGESLVRLADKKDVTWEDAFRGDSVPAEFARELERELAELKQKIDALT